MYLELYVDRMVTHVLHVLGTVCRLYGNTCITCITCKLPYSNVLENLLICTLENSNGYPTSDLPIPILPEVGLGLGMGKRFYPSCTQT